MRTLALAATFAIACSGPRAARTVHHAELAIGVSLVGVLAGGLLIGAIPEHKPIGIVTSAVFGGLAVASAIVYGVAYANRPPSAPPPPPPPDHRPEAWALTKEAQSAARSGDCARVRSLDPQIRELDTGVHDVVFARDAAVARCLAGALP